MTFVPGKTPIKTSGQVTGSEEADAGIEAILSGWWAHGKYARRFERGLGQFLNIKHVRFCNSGSSANLLAMAALKRFLPPGSPIFTVAAAFPTTVAAILHAGYVPVFVDVDMTLNANPDRMREAIAARPERPYGVFLAHTLGNPWDVDKITNDTTGWGWFVEDNCDALGSKWNGRLTGTFGGMSTCSFYPAHHITTGEGGAVFTNNEVLAKIVESLRDWGRDCWCLPGCDNTCGARFEQQHGDLPFGYDHKYVYSNVGYNLKATDIQAAIGCAQLPKLHDFIWRRKLNWQRLRQGLTDLADHFQFQGVAPEADPSWFGFALTITNPKLKREVLCRFLNQRLIETRVLFAGNILRQPGFKDIPHKVIGSLDHTDFVATNTFWIGCYPGLTMPMLDFVIESLHDYVKENR